jgi:hypothetical protein
MALSSCPECQKELSDTAWNCPHCGWHKSRAGVVVAWIVAAAILAFFGLVYYQISEANKAYAELQKQNEKADRMIKALKR